MSWLKRLVKAVQSNGSAALTWRTPNNDLIHLVEYKYGKIVIRTSHCGDITISTSEKKSINRRKISNALAASFIHSYDACVLKTSFKGWDAPIALIHDCLKVLPNDMDEALDRIKKGFVEVCNGDPLARLADDLGITPDQLPRLKQGSGNLLAVRYSDYMFN